LSDCVVESATAAIAFGESRAVARSALDEIVGACGCQYNIGEVSYRTLTFVFGRNSKATNGETE